ncbi:MAG: hypothetical protein R2784_04155 [Saprospiraceae bacterium]
MKKSSIYKIFILAIVFQTGNLMAQYDDLYYDPSIDGNSYGYTEEKDYNSDDNSENNSYRETENRNNYDYDDDGYSYDDNYDFYYTSRIRRFHRPYYGFNYFDPVYVDAYYYDPFIWRPGVTVMIYDDFWSYNSFRRWNRWNRWNNWNRWNTGFYPYNNWNRGFYDPFWEEDFMVIM